MPVIRNKHAGSYNINIHKYMKGDASKSMKPDLWECKALSYQHKLCDLVSLYSDGHV